MPKGSALNKAAKSMRAPREQAGYRKKVGRAVKMSANQKSTVGSISAAERRTIRKLVNATRAITTEGEARGVRKQLRRAAKKS